LKRWFDWESILYQICTADPAKVGFLALLAERKFDNLRGINIPLEFDSVSGHHFSRNIREGAA
jgi:hypothetical protein